ncbi:MAG: methyltransferase domain-containing protein [Pseudonocardiaceae bacterium]
MNAPDSWAVDTDRTRMLRAKLVAELVRAGDITDERWRHVFATVPRHALVPRYYRADNYQEIDGTTGHDHPTWLRSVYSDETLITQKTTHTVTSSGTMPGLVALMLRALNVHDHQRVLQIGTGTGYTAALLCERLGPQHVTTIDIDSHLVQAATTRLAAVGYRPTAIAGNGSHGYFPHAPYDRFLATCSLSRIPTAWLAQARPGARVVAPIAKGLITLDVADENHAAGHFLSEGGYFMPLRDTAEDADNDTEHTATPQTDPRHTELGPRDTFYHQHMRFLITVALPDLSVGQHGPSLNDLIIRDHAGSTARLDTTDHGTFLVTETGPRALWAEVEQLYQQWQACNQPHRERFGLSITPGRQWVWLDTPDGPHTWDLPA